MNKPFSTPRDIFADSDPVDCATCPSDRSLSFSPSTDAKSPPAALKPAILPPRHDLAPPYSLGRLDLRDSSY